MLNIGGNSLVSKRQILAITEAKGAPLIRLRQHAEDNHKVINCTKGEVTRSLIHLVDGYIVLSSRQPETLYKRWVEDI